MKKVISLILVALLLTATCSVAFSAYSVVDEGATSAKEAVEAFEQETETTYTKARVYFQMPNGKNGPAADEDVMVHRTETDPETGEVISEYDETFIHAGEKTPSWFCDYNILPADGKHYAGIYWWDSGIADPSAWAGYRMEIENEEMGIYYVDLPCSEDLTTIIFNNGVDGGMDKTQPIYPWAYQTADLNCEGAGPDEIDTLPYGAPMCESDDEYLAWSFDQCIAICNPNSVTVQSDSGRLQAGVDWYVYYGNGCYGMLYEGCEGFTGDVNQDCCNPDHFVNGVHVGFHEDETVPETEPETEPVHVHTPGEPVRENEVPATYTSAGSYDEVVYCTECGEEISRVTKTIDQLVFTPDPDTLYFDTNGTGWDMGTKGKISFQIFGGDLGTEANPSTGSTWGGKKYLGTAVAGMNGVFSFKPSAKGITLNDGVQYKIIFGFSKTGTGAIDGGQTYDLLFTTDCLGHIAYCDGTEFENPVDSSKKALAAFWRGMDAAEYGPVLQVSSIGNVVGTCPEEGKTPESIFVDFLTVVNEKIKTTGFENARKFVVDVGTKTEQKLIDDIGEGLQLTKQQVFDAFYNNEVETVWDYTVSTLPGDVVVPHTHTAGDPVQENVVPATCTAGGSYDEVVYCTECHEEISRETKTTDALGHQMTFKAEIPATEDANGTKAHYVCSRCNKKFLDEQGTQEATDAQLIIPMLAHTHTPGQAVQENVVPASCKAEGSYDEVVYCTKCGAELSRVHKTIEKLAHTPGTPVKENVVVNHDNTTYDMVTYCTVCGEKLSTEAMMDNIITHTLKFVAKVDSTYDEEGMEAHYECTECGKFFSDATGNIEVSAADLVIPKKVKPVIIDGILGDADDSGEVDIVDVTFIQRIDLDIITADAAMIARADVDKSGSVEITDATRVQRWLVGLNDGLGIGAKIA